MTGLQTRMRVAACENQIKFGADIDSERYDFDQMFSEGIRVRVVEVTSAEFGAVGVCLQNVTDFAF